MSRTKVGLAANRPAQGSARGNRYVAKDTNQEWVSDGVEWIETAGPGGGGGGGGSLFESYNQIVTDKLILAGSNGSVEMIDQPGGLLIIPVAASDDDLGLTVSISGFGFNISSATYAGDLYVRSSLVLADDMGLGIVGTDDTFLLPPAVVGPPTVWYVPGQSYVNAVLKEAADVGNIYAQWTVDIEVQVGDADDYSLDAPQPNNRFQVGIIGTPAS